MWKWFDTRKIHSSKTSFFPDGAQLTAVRRARCSIRARHEGCKCSLAVSERFPPVGGWPTRARLLREVAASSMDRSSALLPRAEWGRPFGRRGDRDFHDWCLNSDDGSSPSEPPDECSSRVLCTRAPITAGSSSTSLASSIARKKLLPVRCETLFALVGESFAVFARSPLWRAELTANSLPTVFARSNRCTTASFGCRKLQGSQSVASLR